MKAHKLKKIERFPAGEVTLGSVRFGQYQNPYYPTVRWNEFNPPAFIPNEIDPDYGALLQVSFDAYRNFVPPISYYELDKLESTRNSSGTSPGSDVPAAADDLLILWGDQAGPMRFSRSFGVEGSPPGILMWPEYSGARKHLHSQRGLEIEQFIVAHFPMLGLKEADLFPSIGDQLDYLGLRYTILDVYTKVENLFENTGLPLHISADAAIYRFGDSKTEIMPGGLPSTPVVLPVPPPAGAIAPIIR